MYEELQFLSYDVEYGLDEKENRIAVPFEFTGEAMERLSILEAVTLILKFADTSLDRVNSTIKGFEEIIKEARERLADAELEDSEKDQTKHQSTIDSRGEKKAKQANRRDSLVKEINKVLRINPEDTEALMEGAEQLLLLLIRNKWIKSYISIDQAKMPVDMLKTFSIAKLIDEPEEEVPTSPVRRIRKPDPLLGKAFAATGVATLIAITWLLFSDKNHLPFKDLPNSRIYKSTLKVGKTRDVEVWRFSPEADLEDEDKRAISLDNGYRIVETAVSGGGIAPHETEILTGKAPLTHCKKSHLDPIANETFIKNFKEEVISAKPIRSRKHLKGYINTFLITTQRTMIVQTKFEGNKLKPVERPLTVTTTYTTEVFAHKAAVTPKRLNNYRFDRKNKDLNFTLGKDEKGQSIITIKRKDGRAFRPVNSGKKDKK